PGADASLPPLVVHAHLDTVPANDDGWLHDPFGGEIVDGELWGRGALDMKAAAAMLLRLQLDFAVSAPPRRNLIVAYFAAEEMAGGLGSRWIVRKRPDVFDGAREAIGEIGGFNLELPGKGPVFFVQTAERGMIWVHVTIPGTGGHAAFPQGGNPLDAA